MKLPSFVSELPIRTAAEFMNYLRLSGGHWDFEEDSPWIFRGHADATWELIPSSRRHHGLRILRTIMERRMAGMSGWSLQAFDEACKNPQALIDSESLRQLFQCAQQRAEYSATAAFVRMADELGLRIDDAFDD
jgi:hypothetical protein